jgi:rod shape determining protein RodA
MGMEGIFGEAVDRIGGEPISARMARRAPIRHLDPALLLAAMSLAVYGAVMIFSATANKQGEVGLDPRAFLQRQIAYIIAGGIVLLAVSLFDYRHLRDFSYVLYGVTMLGLVLVLTPLGDVQKGASRWIDFGFFQAQPSEFAKLAVIVTLAAYFAERKGEVGGFDVMVALGGVAIPGVLIFLEPDLGTMMVLLALSVAILLVAGAKIRHFVGLGFLAIVAIVFVLQAGLLKDYQIDRLTSFLDQNPDVQTDAYNLAQSKIAIGSGGLHGKGLQGENTQTSLDFVPEQHTDFIFTAVGEQLGFVGAATLLGLFALLIWRALRIAIMSRDLFGTLVATGIAAMWAFQVFVNVGMTMGIMPITGIPLPFISYGGSSLVTNFLAVGLLLNIHMRRYLALTDRATRT